MKKLDKYFNYLKLIKREKKFNSLFLFVTSHCNAKCRTCFYWESLNQDGDLTFSQLETLSSTMPKFKKLWLSGGEPFLHKRLADVIHLFQKVNSITDINLPTNGILTERTKSTVEKMLEENPKLTIDLNFSLDGFAETHDSIRGVPNNFEMTTRTIKELCEVRDRNKNSHLRVNVVTVITQENYKELVDFAKYILENTDVSGQYFEIIRGAPLDPDLKLISAKEVRDLYREFMKVHKSYSKKLFRDSNPLLRWFNRFYYLGALKFHLSTQLKVYKNNGNGNKEKAWAMRCTAGETTAVVDYNGDFRSCELRDPIGNLQDYDFDFQKIMNSKPMQDEIKSIDGGNACWCTHSCWIEESLRFSPKVLAFSIPTANFKRIN